MYTKKRNVLLLIVALVIIVMIFIIFNYLKNVNVYPVIDSNNTSFVINDNQIDDSESENNSTTNENSNVDENLINDDVPMNEDSPEEVLDDDIFKIVLLGLDTNDDVFSGRSDAIMVISVNNASKEIRISSFMRDLLVYIEGHGDTKLGHAYAYGRGELVIDTLNRNYNLSLEDYAAVNFISLAEIIDILGGVEVNIKAVEVNEITGVDKSGFQMLNGAQAVQYARIRRVGNGDFERTNRQRVLLGKLIEKFGSYDSDELVQVTLEILPYLSISLSETEVGDFILKESGGLSSYVITEKRFPEPETFYSDLISGVYYLILKDDTNIIEEISDYLNFNN